MRVRLFLSFTLIILVSIIGVVVIVRQNTTTAVRAFMVHGSMSDTNELVSALQSHYQTAGTWHGVGYLLAEQGRGKSQGAGMGHMEMMSNQRLRLSDAEGNIVSDSESETASGMLTADELENSIEITVDDKTVGFLFVEGGMGYNRRDEAYLVERVMDAAQKAALFAGGVSLLLSMLLAYGILRPVRDLTQAARKLGEGDMSQRVDVGGKDELASLAHTFNRMADSLQNAEETRRSMTADIAHELRNPLAVQRANLEAMQDGLYPLSTQALEPVLEQNLFLTRLVSDLRMLALADAGELKLEQVDIELSKLIHQIVEHYKTQAAAANIELLFIDSSPELKNRTVWADPIRIEQIMGNFISNGLRHTPEGGVVKIELKRMNGEVQVSVLDSGVGIPEEALDHIFERFYRADRSRSRQEGGDRLGSGNCTQAG